MASYPLMSHPDARGAGDVKPHAFAQPTLDLEAAFELSVDEVVNDGKP